jgi:hypothetical protein
MYYGDGAGVRRKLIMATVDAKSLRDPIYAQAFHNELARQDMAEHAAKARRERARTDRKASVKRNTRALVTGNTQNAQTAVIILVSIGYLAHRTGYDKVALEKSKVLYAKTKLRLKQYRQKLHSVN